MTVFLIGYRGSGKTTVGHRLAEILHQPFVDSDEHIISAAKMNIREIFQRHGEQTFRDLESKAIHRLAELKDHVISLGGGALQREENQLAISQNRPAIVYLRADPEALLRRIRGDTTTAANRPNLTNLGGGIDEIALLLSQREPIYRKMMTAEVDVTRLSVEDAAQTIVKLLKDR